MRTELAAAMAQIAGTGGQVDRIQRNVESVMDRAIKGSRKVEAEAHTGSARDFILTALPSGVAFACS